MSTARKFPDHIRAEFLRGPEPPNRPKPRQGGRAAPVRTLPQLDAVKWYQPGQKRQVETKVHLTASGIGWTPGAHAAMGRPEYVRVGATEGMIVIMPVKKGDEGAVKIPARKDSAGRVNLRALVRFILAQGWETGTYPARWDPHSKMLVATKPEGGAKNGIRS